MSFSKTRVGVLRGGPSSEYDISLKSGHAVLKNLPTHYHPIDICISKDGIWHVGGLVRKPHDALSNVDVVFNALHGEYGEDGKVQRVLDESGIPYTGTGSFASAVAMNKALTKEDLAKKIKIQTPRFFIVRKREAQEDRLKEIFNAIHPPYIIKPISLGSSVGVSVAKTVPELEAFLVELVEKHGSAMVEEFISGREAACGVVDRFRESVHYALPPIEIIPPENSPFFDYDAKYGGKSREICPGRFTEKEKKGIEELSQKIHEALDLRHYSRSDFIIHPERGIYFLEVNTLPGLTEESLMPKALDAVGISMPSFLDHVLSLALEGK